MVHPSWISCMVENRLRLRCSLRSLVDLDNWRRVRWAQRLLGHASELVAWNDMGRKCEMCDDRLKAFLAYWRALDSDMKRRCFLDAMIISFFFSTS